MHSAVPLSVRTDSSERNGCQENRGKNFQRFHRRHLLTIGDRIHSDASSMYSLLSRAAPPATFKM